MSANQICKQVMQGSQAPFPCDGLVVDNVCERCGWNHAPRAAETGEDAELARFLVAGDLSIMFHDGKGRSLSVEEKVTILNALCASSSPTEVAEGEGEALNDLIRLLEQRYRDMGDTLARKAATALRAAPSLSREEWEMLNAVLDDLADGLIGPSGWATLRAKVREWAKSRP